MSGKTEPAQGVATSRLELVLSGGKASEGRRKMVATSTLKSKHDPAHGAIDFDLRVQIMFA